MNRKNELATLLNKTRLELSTERGYIVSGTEFANWLGISGASLSQYVNGNQVPEGTNLRKIGSRLGAPFYKIMGISIPPSEDPLLRSVVDNWQDVDENTRQRIVEIVTGGANAQPVTA